MFAAVVGPDFTGTDELGSAGGERRNYEEQGEFAGDHSRMLTNGGEGQYRRPSGTAIPESCRPGGLSGWRCAPQNLMKALVGWASWPTPAFKRASLACVGREAYTTWVLGKGFRPCATD